MDLSKVLAVVQNLLAHGPEYVFLLNGVLMAVIALCLVIPGEQPEKSLQKAVDFLSKFSRKPKEEKPEDPK